MSNADLRGADLFGAELQEANLTGTNLQGANLAITQLQGADLSEAKLQGANLREANIYGVIMKKNTTELIDAIKLTWKNELKSTPLLNAIKPHRQSCLATKTLPLHCEKRYDPQNPKELADFKKQLHSFLANLASESPYIARGIINQRPYAPEEPSSRLGLAAILVKRLDARNAPGLQALSDEEKDELRAKAKEEQEWLKNSDW